LGIDTLIANILVWLRFVITYSRGFVCIFSDILSIRHESMRDVAGDNHFCHVLGKHMHWQSSSTGDTLLGMFITAVTAVLYNVVLLHPNYSNSLITVQSLVCRSYRKQLNVF